MEEFVNIVAQLVGQNIRKYRKNQKLSQENLAEKSELSTNHISKIERGETNITIDSFVRITNALGVSADMILSDVIDASYPVQASLLSEKMEKLSREDRQRIDVIVEAFLKNTKS